MMVTPSRPAALSVFERLKIGAGGVQGRLCPRGLPADRGARAPEFAITIAPGAAARDVAGVCPNRRDFSGPWPPCV